MAKAIFRLKAKVYTLPSGNKNTASGHGLFYAGLRFLDVKELTPDQKESVRQHLKNAIIPQVSMSNKQANPVIFPDVLNVKLVNKADGITSTQVNQDTIPLPETPSQETVKTETEARNERIQQSAHQIGKALIAAGKDSSKKSVINEMVTRPEFKAITEKRLMRIVKKTW